MTTRWRKTRHSSTTSRRTPVRPSPTSSCTPGSGSNLCNHFKLRSRRRRRRLRRSCPHLRGRVHQPGCEPRASGDARCDRQLRGRPHLHLGHEPDPVHAALTAGRGVPPATHQRARDRPHARRLIRRQVLPLHRANHRASGQGDASAGQARPHPRRGVRDDHQARRARADEDRRPSRRHDRAPARSLRTSTPARMPTSVRASSRMAATARPARPIFPTSGSTRTPSTPTCRPPAPSAATASARPRGRTRRRPTCWLSASAWTPSTSGCATCWRATRHFATGEVVEDAHFKELLATVARQDRLGARFARPRAVGRWIEGPSQRHLLHHQGHGHAIDVHGRGQAQRRWLAPRADELRRDGPGHPHGDGHARG